MYGLGGYLGATLSVPITILGSAGLIEFYYRVGIFRGAGKYIPVPRTFSTIFFKIKALLLLKRSAPKFIIIAILRFKII